MSRRPHRLRLGPFRLTMLFFAATLSGCSWMFVPRTPDKYEAQGMPCESSYSWPIADAGMAGLGVPGTAIGSIYALQTSCLQGSDCETQNIASVVAGVVGIIAIFIYIGAHHDGMRRVTQCRRANIRYRFANRTPQPAPAPAPTPPAAGPVVPVAPVAPTGPIGATPDPNAPTGATGAAGTVGATVPVNVPGSDPAAPAGAVAPVSALPPAAAVAALTAASGSTASDPTGLPAPPVAPPSSGSGQILREVSFHDSAIDELGRLGNAERDRLRAGARALSGNPYPLEAITLKAPYDGRHGLPVTGTGRVLVYRVGNSGIVIEAILPGAAFGIVVPAAGATSAPTPPPARPAPAAPAPPAPPADAGGDPGFVPPP